MSIGAALTLANSSLEEARCGVCRVPSFWDCRKGASSLLGRSAVFTPPLTTVVAVMELYLQRVIRVIWERTAVGLESYLLTEEERVDCGGPSFPWYLNCPDK